MPVEESHDEIHFRVMDSDNFKCFSAATQTNSVNGIHDSWIRNWFYATAMAQTRESFQGSTYVLVNNSRDSEMRACQTSGQPTIEVRYEIYSRLTTKSIAHYNFSCGWLKSFAIIFNVMTCAWCTINHVRFSQFFLVTLITLHEKNIFHFIPIITPRDSTYATWRRRRRWRWLCVSALKKHKTYISRHFRKLFPSHENFTWWPAANDNNLLESEEKNVIPNST